MFKGKDNTEIEKIWSDRMFRMKAKRKKYEDMWDVGFRSFIDGILTGDDGKIDNRLYDPIYEQYSQSMYSKDGLNFGDIKYPLLHGIVLRALATEFKNRPTANFIAYGSNSPSRATGFNHLFQQVLADGNADNVDFEVMLDRRIRGTGAVLQLTEQIELTVQEPIGLNEETGELEYEEKVKSSTQIGYKKIDLRHLWLDPNCTQSDLSDCYFLALDEYISKEEASLRFLLKYKLKEEDIKEVENMEDKGSPFYDSENTKSVRITHLLDRRYDRYHIMMNGKLINKAKNPIPRIAGRRGKDLPVVLAPMYKIPGSPYGYGDAHVVSKFKKIKDLARLMILEISQKIAKGTLVVDPESAFDEQGFTWGQDVIRGDPKDFSVLPTAGNLDILYKMDETADNDIIQATGINIKDTTNADIQETARKTVIRKESQNAIIELGMNYISGIYFKRLYNLLKDDIKLYYGAALAKGEEVKVRTKDVKMSRDPKTRKLKKYKVSGYRYFDLEAGDMDFEAELILEMGNISTSAELEKALALEFLDYIQMAPEGFDPAGLAKYIQELGSMPESVLAASAPKDPAAQANEGLEADFLPEAERAKLAQATAAPEQPLPPEMQVTQDPNVPIPA